MHTKLALGALVLTTALASTAAHAEQRWPNWYLGLSGSVGFLQDGDVGGAGAGGNTEMGFDTGWGAGVSLGYLPATSMAPFNYMRFEAEILYHTNGNDTITPAGSALGDFSAVSYMANAYYDLPTDWAVTPYIGGGLGVTTAKLSRNSGLGNTTQDDTNFSYQAMVGLAYRPSRIPNTEWTLGYRYLGMSTPSFSTAGGDVEVDYNLHNVEAGLKLRF